MNFNHDLYFSIFSLMLFNKMNSKHYYISQQRYLLDGVDNICYYKIEKKKDIKTFTNMIRQLPWNMDA